MTSALVWRGKTEGGGSLGEDRSHHSNFRGCATLSGPAETVSLFPIGRFRVPLSERSSSRVRRS
jgi:hypothetical protein